MSTELEVYDEGEVVGPQALNKKQAKALEKKLRAAADKVETNFNALLDLMEQAFLGEIHKALGLKSWSAYIADAANINVSDKWEREALVSLMSGKGMSQRAIASALGVSVSTVNRDLSGVPSGTREPDADPVPTTGIDGKTYKRKDIESEQEPLDVEEVAAEPEPEQQPEPEPKQVPLTRDFREEMDRLLIDVQAFKDILDDDRFDEARERIATTHLNKLQQAIADLQKVADVLMGGNA